MSEAYWINKIENKPNFKLGQNFLVDTNISRKITKLVQGQLADPIIEIGPGTGSLTNELLNAIILQFISPTIQQIKNDPKFEQRQKRD